MKHPHTCLSALILIFLAIAGTIFNARYLDKTVYDILNTLDKLPEESYMAYEIITEIKFFWEERRKILSFTLSETSLDRVSLLFDEIMIAAEHGDDEEYQKATARLRRAVESINQLEKISLANIF